MTLWQRLRNVFFGRPDSGMTLDPEAIRKAKQATQSAKSYAATLARQNDNDRFLRGVMDGLHR